MKSPHKNLFALRIGCTLHPIRSFKADTFFFVEKGDLSQNTEGSNHHPQPPTFSQKPLALAQAFPNSNL
jgi:hypothetical protein